MGGDHKCPLCSATFTRPQHVGRHLRAHTGDRPYECKECPLRFARSDLLSRHVNKAHPKANGAHDNDRKNDKKNRRKSLPTQPMVHNVAPAPPPTLVSTSTLVPAPPEPTPYQAQRMYPNHPLLQQNHPASWSATQLDLGAGAGGTTYGVDIPATQLGSLDSHSAISFGHPFGATTMHYSGSEHGSSTSPVAFGSSMPSSLSSLGFESSLKKRACDQCNHSKVRCDFAEPCARCSHRSMQCTYTKPQRARSIAYPISATVAGQMGTSPTAGGLAQSPTAGFHPSSGGSPRLTHSVYERRSSGPASMTFLTSDALFGANRLHGRPPVPDPQWETAPAQGRQGLQVATGLGGQFISQSPTSGAMGLTLTPTLTNSTSPTTSESTDRRGSSNSAMLGSWSLPPSVVSQESAVNFVNGYVPTSDQSGLPTVFQTNQQFVWPNSAGGFDPSTLPSGSALAASEDEETPPGTANEDSVPHRRRSSAGVWANALQQMRLDDPTTAPVMPVAEQQQQQQQMGNFQYPPRHTTFPFLENELQPNSRPPSSSDGLWKYFLDPMALATPEKMPDVDLVDLETPRGLSKSNSMPDLTTPPMDAAAYPAFPGPLDGFAHAHEHDRDCMIDPRDDATIAKWKDHIQQRHASFSMNLDPDLNVRTKQLTNATFASSTNRLVRPPVHILHSSALDQTLAPERTPSFGSPMIDQNGALLTPGGNMFRNSRTPTKMFNLYHSMDVRPGNKRQASQTLISDSQKRGSFSAWADDEGGPDDNISTPNSRRGSGPAAAKTPNMPMALQTSWVSTDPSRAS